MEDATVVGNYPYQRIMSGREQLGMLTPERGMISLTLQGGARLLSQGINRVEIGGFALTGNLFAVGIEKADPGIRVGDEVLIVHKGELKGVGVASMSGPEMNEAERGEAVRVRHKLKS